MRSMLADRPGSRRQQNDLQVINGVVSGTLEDYGLKSPWATNGIGFAITGEYRKYATSRRVWRLVELHDL